MATFKCDITFDYSPQDMRKNVQTTCRLGKTGKSESFDVQLGKRNLVRPRLYRKHFQPCVPNSSRAYEIKGCVDGEKAKDLCTYSVVDKGFRRLVKHTSGQ